MKKKIFIDVELAFLSLTNETLLASMVTFGTYDSTDEDFLK